jgi:hypothetical protein
MAQTKILLDTNSYLRLAQNLHPLLFAPYGNENFTLYAHKDLRDECMRQPRLANKFDWITLEKYEENRKKPLAVSKEMHAEIDLNFGFMWGQVESAGLTPSKIDTRILATALALGIRVVTDDQGMLELAAEYEVETWTTLELMKSMVDAEHITQKQVRRVVEQWVYDEDLPSKKLRQPYRKFFGEDPPSGF